MIGGKIVLSAESPKTSPLEGREFKGHPLCCAVKQKRATPALNQGRVCMPPDIRGVVLPPTVSGEAEIETESNCQGLRVSENSAEGQGNRQAVVVCWARAHGCVEQALMKMTEKCAWKQAGAGGIDEGMDGQHSYPHIHNVLASPPSLLLLLLIYPQILS